MAHVAIQVWRRPWGPILISSAIHCALLFQFFGPTSTNTTVPLGHWVEMVPGGQVQKMRAHNVTPSTPSPLDQPADKSEQASSTKATPALGNTTQATGLSGQIGDLNGAQVSVRARYLYELEAFLNQNKTYPARARHLNQSGDVEIAFHVHGDGSITDPHVVRPCIHDLLNRSAIELVSSVGRFQPIPKELGLAVLHVTVPIRYELN